MSLEATQWAWKQSDLSPGAKLVLLYLADAANRANGFLCWMSNSAIAKATGQGVRTVYRLLMELEAAGLIEDESRRGQSTIWRLKFENHPGQNGRTSANSAEGDTSAILADTSAILASTSAILANDTYIGTRKNQKEPEVGARARPRTEQFLKNGGSRNDRAKPSGAVASSDAWAAGVAAAAARSGCPSQLDDRGPAPRGPSSPSGVQDGVAPCRADVDRRAHSWVAGALETA